MQIADRFSGATSFGGAASSWRSPAISDNARYIAAVDPGRSLLVVFANPLSP